MAEHRWCLPNQELAVLYGGLTLIYGGQLSMYFSHMLRVNMTRDLAHLQLSALQGEIIRSYMSVLQAQKFLYAERKGCYPY